MLTVRPSAARSLLFSAGTWMNWCHVCRLCNVRSCCYMSWGQHSSPRREVTFNAEGDRADCHRASNVRVWQICKCSSLPLSPAQMGDCQLIVNHESVRQHRNSNLQTGPTEPYTLNSLTHTRSHKCTHTHPKSGKKSMIRIHVVIYTTDVCYYTLNININYCWLSIQISCK